MKIFLKIIMILHSAQGLYAGSDHHNKEAYSIFDSQPFDSQEEFEPCCTPSKYAWIENRTPHALALKLIKETGPQPSVYPLEIAPFKMLKIILKQGALYKLKNSKNVFWILDIKESRRYSFSKQENGRIEIKGKKMRKKKTHEANEK